MPVANQKNNLSRRKFLATTGGFTLSFIITGFISGRNKEPKDQNVQEISAWVSVGPDGKVTIFSPAAEMGQGSMTALAVLIAEEMDADWQDVVVEHSPIEPEIYGLQWGGKLGGPMITVGSRTVRGYYKSLRHAGAQVRYVMKRLAANLHQVDFNELSTSPSKVMHRTSGRSWTYGSLSQQEIDFEIPEIPEAKWKKPEEFRLIGRSVNRVDVADKSNGKAIFAMDVQLPDMVYASMWRTPVNGMRPEIRNEKDILAIDGVLDLVLLDHGIAVVANHWQTAELAKKQMQINWNGHTQALGYDSEKAVESYEQLATGGEVGKILVSKGEMPDEYAHHAVYKNDFAYHAQMEPLNAVVSLSSNGESAEVWVGSQSTDGARKTAARTLGIPFEQVTLRPCFLGGGFGRRSMSDYVEEACIIAKKVRKPVKLIWSREDDVRYGAFRPMSVQSLSATLDREGRIVAWQHIIAGTGDGLMTSGIKIPYYHIPNQHIEVRNVDQGIRTKHWRAVGHGPNKFAIETFLDEICLATGMDPFEMRLQLLQNSPREKAVVQKVAQMSDWGSTPPKGRARGMAFAERSGTLAAGVAEISLTDFEIKVHHFWCAIDAGVVVHRDNTIAQLEGGIIFGLSSVLKERITFQEGKVQQSNFHDYPLLRLSEAPESIDIEIIDSQEDPMGIGEASLPVVGGAIANAFLALTGKAIRHMPFTKSRVKACLT